MPRKPSKRPKELPVNIIHDLVETIAERIYDKVVAALANRLGPVLNRLERNTRCSSVQESGTYSERNPKGGA